MGFSVEQARVALAATSTGLDVQAALETLLSNGAGSEPSDSNRRRAEEPTPRRRPPRSNSTARPAQERLSRDTPSPSGSQQERNTQADKILAQASEIGLSVFNRANAFWNQSKEIVQKAYEERAKTINNPGPSQPSRPRWMQEETQVHRADSAAMSNTRNSGYSDDIMKEKQIRSTGAKGEPQIERHIPSKAPNLFADEPIAYVSPFRRGRQPTAEKPNISTSRSSSPTSISMPPPRVPSPVKLTQRQTIPASHAEIASSAKHKSIGTEKFQLGQYAEAEAAYTAAIAVLPESHLLLVPLYNNRALTRLKTGDYTGAVEDCTTVVSLIGPNYHPKKEAQIDKVEDGSGVHLADGLVKAWKRRAEAYEGKEKWALAQADLEAVAAADWAGEKLRHEAVRGAHRCRTMVTANNSNAGRSSISTGNAPTTNPVRMTRLPNRRGPTPPSEAQIQFREASKAAEAEDQARHELKDTVDARWMAWKGGKESNIRALIASLDAVLWPELGWQKVGMAELVTPAQVKIRYTKAIAKLHPDKVWRSSLWVYAG
jgi:tetratricopeptide (TPR) repeat protein